MYNIQTSELLQQEAILAKVCYSFRTLLRERKIPQIPKHITIPIKYEYPIGLKNQLKERTGIIFDQMATRSLALKDGDSKYFNVIVRKMLLLAEEIKPELCFVPGHLRADFLNEQNIEETKHIHELFKINEKDYLAGLVFGDHPDIWIQWINVSRQRTKWGVMTEDNSEAARFIAKELKNVEHIHLFETNWLTNQHRIKKLAELAIDKITFDDSLYSQLKTTSQILCYNKPNLAMESGEPEIGEYMCAIENFLK